MAEENAAKQSGAYVHPSGTFQRLGRRIKSGLAVVGGLTIGVTLAASYASSKASKLTSEKAIKLPDEFLLEIDLESAQLVETSPLKPLQLLGQASRQLELRDFVKGLTEAATDERLKGVIAYIGDNNAGCGLAAAEEARRAVLDFRKRNRGQAATVAFSTSFGEAGTRGFSTYFLASAFEKVYLQPTGLLSITGLSIEQPFFKNLLARWKVRPYVSSREEFKGVVEGISREKFSEPNRLALDELLTSMTRTVTKGIADARMTVTPDVIAAVNAAPLSAAKALSLRLVDGLKYRDEAKQIASGAIIPPDTMPAGTSDTVQAPLPSTSSLSVKETKASASKVATVSLARYLKSIKAKEAAEKKTSGLLSNVLAQWKESSEKATESEVALVMAEGSILQGGGQVASSEKVISSVKMCNQLRKLREDRNVKAVVLRVNSPGGSAVASDTICREIKAIRDAGKPVAISMGNVAASGGYYISTPASIIFAQRTTITGSIGVAFAKFNIGNALKSLGIDIDSVSEGDNATALSPFTDFTEAQAAAVEEQIDTIYAQFLQRVVEGRGLTADATRQAAKGRVWSGADAVRLGLADRLGGLQEALEWAQAATTSDEGKKPAIQRYPKALSLGQILRKLRDQEPIELTASPLPLLMRLLATLAGSTSGSNSPDQLVSWLSGLAAECSREASLEAGPVLMCDIDVV